jgi:hypothetical protein
MAGDVSGQEDHPWLLLCESPTPSGPSTLEGFLKPSASKVTATTMAGLTQAGPFKPALVHRKATVTELMSEKARGKARASQESLTDIPMNGDALGGDGAVVQEMSRHMGKGKTKVTAKDELAGAEEEESRGRT